MRPVLVVAGDDDLRMTILDVLSLEGFSARGAQSAPDALRVASELDAPPYTVLVDVIVADRGTCAFVAALRRIPRYSDVAIVGMCSMKTPEQVVFDSVLLKPFTIADLLEPLRSSHEEHCGTQRLHPCLGPDSM